MKKNQSLIFIFIIILFTGCSNHGINSSENNSISANNEQPQEDWLQDEEKEIEIIKQKIKLNKFTASPSIVSLYADVELLENNDLDYIITVDQPEKRMENVKISYLLDPSLEFMFKTNNVFGSNMINLAESPELYLLEPNGEVKGIRIGENYGLYSLEIPDEFMNIYQDIYVHLEWQENEKHKEEFIKIKAKPSQELSDFLNSLNSHS